MKKVIAIDYGLKKIGTAVGDTIMQIAFPKEIFYSKEELFKLIEFNSYEIIIVGNPKTNKNTYSEQQDLCESFFYDLQKKYSDKKIYFQDERFSSKIAQRKMRDIGLNQKKGKLYEDNFAAQVLLEEFFELYSLDFNKN